MRMDDLPSPSVRRRRTKNRGGLKKPSPKAKAIKRRVFVDSSISVANLAHGMSVKGTILIKKLIALGQPATLNDELDFETAQLLGEEFDYEVVNTAFDEEKYMMWDNLSSHTTGYVTALVEQRPQPPININSSQSEDLPINQNLLR